MPEVRKQRFMVNLEDEEMVKIRVIRALTGRTYQDLMSEAVRLLAQRYDKEMKAVIAR